MFWDLLSSLDEDDLTYNPTWKHYPFMQQKIVGVHQVFLPKRPSAIQQL
jgi:hypothetical protein